VVPKDKKSHSTTASIKQVCLEPGFGYLGTYPKSRWVFWVHLPKKTWQNPPWT